MRPQDDGNGNAWSSTLTHRQRGEESYRARGVTNAGDAQFAAPKRHA
jgi:hypothetical protein